MLPNGIGSSDARNAGLFTTGFKCVHKHSPQVNEICEMEELGFEPADEGKGVKPSLNAGSSAL
jgi:hypothetical protein